MARKPSLSSTISTRDRILTAAMHRFSHQSYDETGLREIAADASVDVAYVHRCFGSKQRLFAEVIRNAVSADHFLDDLSSDPVDALTRRILSPESTMSSRATDPLSVAVHSLSSREAIEVHRDFVANDLIEPLAHRLGGPARHRAALMVAFMAGLSTLKNVVGIDELKDSERGTIAPMVRGVFEALAYEGAAGHRKSTVRASRRK